MIHASYCIVFVATALFFYSAVSAQGTQCGTNEAKYRCGPRCEDRCSAPPPPSCNGLRCTFVACRCKDGFARDPRSNQCIAKANCPANGCAVGEFYAACGRRCEGTCASPKEPETCPKIRCTDWACRCDLAGGFVRNNQGTCVRTGEC